MDLLGAAVLERGLFVILAAVLAAGFLVWICEMDRHG